MSTGENSTTSEQRLDHLADQNAVVEKKIKRFSILLTRMFMGIAVIGKQNKTNDNLFGEHFG